MKLTQLPYVLRSIDTVESRAHFINYFSVLNDDDNESAAGLISKFIRQLQHQRTEIRIISDALTSSTSLTAQVVEAETKRMADMITLADKLEMLIIGIKDRLEEDSGNGMALAYINVKYDKCLGTVKNLPRLRQLIDEMSQYRDDEEITDWLCDEYDLVRCEDCGDYEYSSKSVECYHGQTICRHCIDHNYRWSAYYDKYIHVDYARDGLDADGDECVVDCDDDNFYWDDDADQYVHNNYQSEPRVLGGYHDSKRRQQIIHDPWSDARSRWLGVELECEIRNDDVSREEKARQLNDIINGGEIGKRVFFETDGSLNNGIEIISQPMSMPMHTELWTWLKNSDAIRYMRSHNTSTCGLHVHVSRGPLTQDQIAKMVVFVNDRNNEHLIRAVARRYAEGYCRIKEKDLTNAHQSSDRYEAINITSDKTIEFRIFKGSLKYESVMAAIQFANTLTEFTAIPNLAVSDLTTDKFMDFASSFGDDASMLVPYVTQRLELA